MSTFTKLLKYDDLSKLKAALQRAFGKAEVPAPRKFSEGWLAASAYDMNQNLTYEGAEVVIRLRDGRAYVGALVRAGVRSVTLKLWGCDGEQRSFPRGELVGVSIVPAHSYADERQVRQRQRRGEPAHVYAAPLRTRRSEPAAAAVGPGSVVT